MSGCYSIIGWRNLFFGVKLSIRSFCFISQIDKKSVECCVKVPS